MRDEESVPGNWLAPFRWLLAHRRVAKVELLITTHGSGPLAEETFDELLREVKLTPYQVSDQTCLLVLGREGWDEQTLEALLRYRAGLDLRVYSQEMFISYLATGEDPLEASAETLDEFIADHPGLEFLAGWGFPWPDTIVSFGGSGADLGLDLPKRVGWATSAMEDPIDLSETDLAWLKQGYYEGRKRFPWPRT